MQNSVIAITLHYGQTSWVIWSEIYIHGQHMKMNKNQTKKVNQFINVKLWMKSKTKINTGFKTGCEIHLKDSLKIK